MEYLYRPVTKEEAEPIAFNSSEIDQSQSASSMRKTSSLKA